MRHVVKIWPQYFCRVADGSKTFELRKNDRGYQPSDTIILREWDDGIFTGKELTFKIGYVLPIDNGMVVFSLLPSDQE